ncbi:MAG: hypothetical protein ACTSQI_13640 [Candidatus Helarchaeota archaeon]
MPKDKSGKEKKERSSSDSKVGTIKTSPEQNIPEEVLQQLPPEVKAQLGYKEEQKPIFKAPSGPDAGLSDSIERLREGFEKIGLTLIGRMGEFASTLERVVMTVARIEKVEKSTAETTYFLKGLQKTLENMKRDFNKVVDKIGNLEIDVERIANEVTGLKSQISTAPVPLPLSQQSVNPVEKSSPLSQHVVKEPISPPIDTPIPPENQPTKPVQTPPPPTGQPLAQIHTPSAPSLPTSEITTPPITSSSGTVESIFTNLKSQIKVGANSIMIADLLDNAREQISETCKWTPAIYEIGKLARALRKNNNVLTQTDELEITQLLDQWNNQISQG